MGGGGGGRDGERHTLGEGERGTKAGVALRNAKTVR